MSNVPTNEAFKKITSNNITDDYIQLIRGSDKSVLLWVDANGVVQGPWAAGLGGVPAGANTDVQSNSNGAFYGDGNFTYNPGVKVSGPIFNAATGFEVAGGAASGHYLRGNGTNFVSSGIQAGDMTWDQIGNAAGALTLANGANPTTFDHTSAVLWTWANTTAATSLVNQSSPSLTLAGTYWTGSASALDSWTLQNIPGSGLNIAHAGGPSNTIQITNSNVNLSSGVVSAPTLFAALNGAASGEVYNITSVGNASAGLTTYQAPTTPQGGPVLGQRITITGFTNAGNNGHFVVFSSNTTSITVYNSGGIAETHAATGTADVGYYSTGGYTFAAGAGSTFPITGNSTYTSAVDGDAVPFNPNFTWSSKANGTDAGYIRIINDGSTGNHGTEIGAVIDGTGAAPVQIQMGLFSSFTGVLFPQPVAATSGANKSSNSLVIQSSYWTGSVAAPNSWSFQDVLGSGSNPTSTLTIQQSGSSGAPAVSIVAALTAKTLTINTATPTGTANQVSFGNTQGIGNGSATNLQAPAKSTGTGPATLTAVNWLEIDIAGSKYWVPLYQ